MTLLDTFLRSQQGPSEVIGMTCAAGQRDARNDSADVGVSYA